MISFWRGGQRGGAPPVTPGPLGCAPNLDWTPSWAFSWAQALGRLHVISEAGWESSEPRTHLWRAAGGCSELTSCLGPKLLGTTRHLGVSLHFHHPSPPLLCHQVLPICFMRLFALFSEGLTSSSAPPFPGFSTSPFSSSCSFWKISLSFPVPVLPMALQYLRVGAVFPPRLTGAPALGLVPLLIFLCGPR